MKELFRSETSGRELIFVLPVMLVLVFSGCMSLDPFLFKGKEVDRYLFDDYSGGPECEDAVDSLGPVESSTVHEVSMVSGDAEIAGILVSEATEFDSTDTVILYFHGTSKHIDHYWPRTRLLAATGYPVFTIDYRGYGLSSGEPTEQGIYEDGYAALDYLRENLGNPNVVVYSYSLGSLVGCEVASRNPNGRIIALVLEAPIGSVETLVQDAVYMNLPGSYVTSFSGKNVEKIKEVTVPLLWFHGTGDETLDLQTNGKQVYRNYAGEQGWYRIVKGAGHQTIPSVIGYDRYVKGVADFVSGNADGNSLFSAGTLE